MKKLNSLLILTILLSGFGISAYSYNLDVPSQHLLLSDHSSESLNVITLTSPEAFSVSPTSRSVGSGAGSTYFTVSSTVGWSVEDDASWLTATKTSGSNISVSFSANLSPSSRTANIRAYGTGGVEQTVTVKQAGVAVTFDVSPNSRSVSSLAGNTSFSVNSSVGWSVEDDASWLTATKTSGSTISVSYNANYSTSSRTANIRAYGTGGVEEIVKVFQAGVIFDVTPNSRGVSSAAGTTSFTVASDVGWSVEDDASWLTATKTNGTTISVSYSANFTTTSRTANIRAYGTGGVEETVVVKQAGIVVTFDVTPNSRNVSSSAGNTSFSVNSSVGWSVEDDASWLTATKTSGSTISVSYDANYSTSSRTANIRAYGTGGVEEIVKVFQAGVTFDVTPNSRSVGSSAGNTSFTVASDVGWSVEDDASWLTATKTNGTTISVSYNANSSSSSRTANIRAYGTGGVEETVTVTQSGVAVTFDVTPNSRSVSSSAGNTSFSVNSSVGWSVEDDAGWLTATKTDGSTISVSYTENTSSSSRTANIRAYGTGGVEEIVTVTQAGSAVFDVTPNSRSVSSSAGNTSFSVNSSVGWSVEDDASWLTATKTDGSTISVSYTENTSTSSRTANIRAYGTGGVEEIVQVTQAGTTVFDVTPNSRSVSSSAGNTSFSVNSSVGWSVEDDAGWLTATKTDGSTISVSYTENTSSSSRTANIRAYGTGGVEEIVTVTQAGTTVFDVSPNSKIVNSEAGTTTFSVNSSVGWSVEDDGDWLTATKTDGSTITVSYMENTSTISRTANIRAWGTGGVEETVTLKQAGGEAHLSLSPLSQTLGSEGGSVIFDVTSNLAFSVSVDSDWITVDLVSSTQITLTCDENSSTEERTAEIMVSGNGVASVTVTVIQSGSATNIDLRSINSDIIQTYPNPVANTLYLVSDIDIDTELIIQIYDITGKLAYTGNINSIMHNESIEIDLSGLSRGVYILKISDSENTLLRKIMKQ